MKILKTLIFSIILFLSFFVLGSHLVFAEETYKSCSLQSTKDSKLISISCSGITFSNCTKTQSSASIDGVYSCAGGNVECTFSSGICKSEIKITASNSSGTCKNDCEVGGIFKNTSKACACCGDCSPDDILVLLNTVLEILFSIVGALGLAMFVYGGFNFVIARGSSDYINRGKNAITNAVIGIVIMFVSGGIVIFIQKTLGAKDVVELTASADKTNSSVNNTKTNVSQYGDKTLGDACVQKSGGVNSTECIKGLYCYVAKQSSDQKSQGVCIPVNPKSDLDAGASCIVLPKNQTMCKTGLCEVLNNPNPTVGTKGVCPSLKALGESCVNDANCEESAVCCSSTACAKHVCIPRVGRNLSEGEKCYILPGSTTNDCKSDLYCKPNDSSYKGGSRSAYIGYDGVCTKK